MKFEIYYTGGLNLGQMDEPEEIRDFPNEKQALDYAYEMACEQYDSSAGSNGIRSPEEIADEEDVGEKEAELIYQEERESEIEYKVKKVVDRNVDRISKEVKNKPSKKWR